MPDIIRDLVALSTTSGMATSPRPSGMPPTGIDVATRMDDNRTMKNTFAVVDLFAGPGGLAEGFSSVRDERGRRVFNIALSVEKEASAYATLTLRSFLRQFDDELPVQYYAFLNGETLEPDWQRSYPEQWHAATNEALQLELGTSEAAAILMPRIERLREEHGGNVILIGGPPCQAYSLVGRSRNRGTVSYVPENDNRHFLYREYITILDRLRPAAFVMENVKGMLSARVEGDSIISMVMQDLARAGDGYTLVPVISPQQTQMGTFQSAAKPQDFIVRSEQFGVPQARHRVIIIGLRTDLVRQTDVQSGVCAPGIAAATVRDVIGMMPPLRSGISKQQDNWGTWRDVMRSNLGSLAEACSSSDATLARIAKRAFACSVALEKLTTPLLRESTGPAGLSAQCPVDLTAWLLDPKLSRLADHSSRSHMPSDMGRYAFAALFAEETGRSPSMIDFPDELAPAHRNWKSGSFADRFRVQTWDRPSSTVTSHISKDGHYFIHPDPLQCRSLTVREAARLQTFPDNYVFKGNRTAQYVQVGNAVPPYLARQIADGIWRLLSKPQEHQSNPEIFA
jgi:DNA (cytosine-5)-methyltransferase 1